ncbi:MAG: hypothetical protein ABSF88_11465 [Candidatus Aminicenantales bacterium]
MASKRLVGTLAIRAGIILLCFASAFAQNASRGVAVQPVRPGIIEAKPLTSFTAVFRVTNRTTKPREFTGRIDLPEGWKLVMAESAFKLAAGAEAVRLVSIFVPVQALAGTYKIGYEVSTSGNPPLADRAEVGVKVLLEARLSLQAMDIPPFAIAGDVCKSKFLVLNQGNAPLDVNLDVISNGFRVDPGAKTLRVEAGQTAPVEVTVQTDGGIRKKLGQLVRVKAEAVVPGQGTLTAEALTQQDIIPRVYGNVDYYNKVPLEIGFVALSTSEGARYAQFKISGTGALDELGRHKVDLLFRGPGRNDFNLFGMQREEYRFRYDSPLLNVNVGDKSFALTNLTQFGEYGRGVEAVLNAGRWSLRGYYERNLFVGSTNNEKALQLGFSPAGRMSLKFSYLMETATARPDSRIFSFQSQYLNDLANLTLEYSWDWTAAKDLRPANSALWLDASGGYKFFSYRANVIQSGSEFNGYYQNLNYRSGELTLSPWPKLQLKASYLDQRRNTAILPYFLPFYDRTFQAGLQWQARKWLMVSLEHRNHDRQDLSLDSQFNYRDSTLRAGAMVNIGSFSLQNFVDYGRTFNEITKKFEKLVEYTFATNFTIIDKLTLGGYLHYRDQDESFTGDKERRLDLNFNVGFQSGRTSFDAFYRTAIHQDLYRSALSEKSFEDPAFLLNNYDMFGISLSQRFGNGHQLSVRVQRAANAFVGTGPANRFIGLVEYSIPLGFPVSRKRSIGMLRGKVYDAENGRKGVEGVIVKVNDLATVTDQSGDYVFHGLEPGSYNLTLDERTAQHSKITLEKTPLNLTVEGGKKLECSIGLTTGASITGRIMVYKQEKPEPSLLVKKGPAPKGPSVSESGEKDKADDAKPKMVGSAALVATAVELVSADEEVFHALTDEDGRFVFDSLRPGTYTLKVYDNNLPELHAFEKDTFTFELKPGSQEKVEINVFPIIRPIQIIQQGEVTIKKKKID